MDESRGRTDGGQSPFLVAVAAALIALTAAAAGERISGTGTGFAILCLLQGLAYAAAVWFVVRRPARGLDLLLVLAVAVLLRAIAFEVPPLAGSQKPTAGLLPIAGIVVDEVQYLLAGISPTVLVAALGDASVVLAVLGCLKALGLPRERVVIYAWHPLSIWQFTSALHLDQLAVVLIILAVLAVLYRRQELGGGLLASAVLIQPVALALAPALWRRGTIAMTIAVVVMATACIASYPEAAARSLAMIADWFAAIANGHGRVGIIEGLRSLGLTVPEAPTALLVALLVSAALAFYALLARRYDEVRPVNLVLLAAAGAVVMDPSNPAQLMWLLPLLALAPVVSVIALSLAWPLLMPGVELGLLQQIIGGLICGGFLVVALAEVAWHLLRHLRFPAVPSMSARIDAPAAAE